MAGTSTAAYAITLNQYATSGGAAKLGMAPPTSNSGSAVEITDAASKGEGLIEDSTDGAYLDVTGYQDTVGATGVASSTGVSRVIDGLSNSGTISPTVLPTAAYSGSSIRAALTNNDDADFWATGSGSSGGDLTYDVAGNPSPTQTQLIASSTEQPQIFNGQLYAGTSGGGISEVTGGSPSGLPTSGSPTYTAFTMSGTNFSSADVIYSFVFDGSSTIYAVDYTSGYLIKFTGSGTTWTEAYGVSLGGTSEGSGVVGNFSGSNPVLYVTTATNLYSVTDSGSALTATSIATPGSGNTFLGVAWAPLATAPTVATNTGASTRSINRSISRPACCTRPTRTVMRQAS